tara:strand:- start:5564 stop:7315 length:1752 start_codon:yes stop_codon:yes gene_type:complete
MYEIIYNNGFFENFATTFIFLFFVTVFCFSRFYINNKEISFFDSYQPIILFFIIFSVIVLFFNILIYFNYFLYFKHILYIIVFSIFLIWFFFSSKINLSIIKKKILYTKKEYLILFFFLIFFLISLLPISDADSIAIHQNLANYIYLNGLESVNLRKNFEFTTLSNSEILLILSPVLQSDNFGSQLNFFALLLVYFIFYKNNKSFIFFIFSCPLIIFFVSTQKLQLFFAILYLLLFILLHQNLIKKKIEIFLFVLLLAFYASAKISYILLALPIYFYFLILHKKKINLILTYSTIIFFIFFIPIFLIKLKFFGNPVAPFFGKYFNVNNDFIDAFSLHLRSSEGWLNNALDFKIFFKPFIPLTLDTLTNSLGILFLFQLFNFSLLKETKFIPIIIIILVILTGQILPRYYFEAFLILSFFYKAEKKVIINLIKFFQGSAILISASIFVFISYFKTNVIFDKQKFMNKFSYSFYNSRQYKNLDIKENILVIPQDRQSIFFNENIYGARGVDVKTLNYDRDSAILSFLKENSIDYIVTADDYVLPNCIVLNNIGDIFQKRVRRNFFVNEQEESYTIYLINIKGCKL